jgi:hypothetical protein
LDNTPVFVVADSVAAWRSADYFEINAVCLQQFSQSHDDGLSRLVERANKNSSFF